MSAIKFHPVLQLLVKWYNGRCCRIAWQCLVYIQWNLNRPSESISPVCNINCTNSEVIMSKFLIGPTVVFRKLFIKRVHFLQTNLCFLNYCAIKPYSWWLMILKSLLSRLPRQPLLSMTPLVTILMLYFQHLNHHHWNHLIQHSYMQQWCCLLKVALLFMPPLACLKKNIICSRVSRIRIS